MWRNAWLWGVSVGLVGSMLAASLVIAQDAPPRLRGTGPRWDHPTDVNPHYAQLAPLAMTSDASATGWRGFTRSPDRRKTDSA